MEQLHSLLQRQLRRHHVELAPLTKEAQDLIEAVNSAYVEFDADRRMLERSLELTSQELLRTNSEMRAVFERLIYSSTDGIFAFDRECRYTVWNPALERLFGLDKLQTLGKSAFDVFPLLKENGGDRFYLDALAGKTVVARDGAYVVPSTGEQVIVESHFSPLLDDSGVIIGGLAILRDVTERKRAEDALRRSKAYLAEAQRLSHTGSFGWDVTSGEIYWSEETFRIFGFDPSKTRPTLELISERIHPDDTLRVQDSINRASRKGADWDIDFRLVMPDGSFKYVQVVAHVVSDELTKVEYVGSVMDFTERKKAEDRFYKAFDANPEPISISTISEGRLIDVNESFLRTTGYQRREVIGRTSQELRFWRRPADLFQLLGMLKYDGRVRDLEMPFLTKSGVQRMGLHSAELVELGGQDCMLAIMKDITESKELEQRMRQSQKMEVVGQLSGGIAHDFNNLLGVIIGYNEIMLEETGGNARLHGHAEKIGNAADRAASLVRQLLAFSRQQVVEKRVLSLNSSVEEMAKLLPRLIGEHIELRTTFASDLWAVKADHGQIDQVIMNLVVNARDAMSEGGKLTLETRNVHLDADYASRNPPTLPGDYAMLIVRDTGCGMDAQTQARVFEPFFTTKEKGKGTGLGLSTVYGAVKQNGGFVWLESELGKGTTFKVYLPRFVGETQQNQAGFPSSQAHVAASETILLVEDEDSLRGLVENILHQSGYNVLVAANGSEAIRVAESHPGTIHLLLTDVVMPEMSGQIVAEKLTALRPGIKVIYMSGYTGYKDRGLLDQDVSVIAKPFTRDALLRKLRDALALHASLK